MLSGSIGFDDALCIPIPIPARAEGVLMWGMPSEEARARADFFVRRRALVQRALQRIDVASSLIDLDRNTWSAEEAGLVDAAFHRFELRSTLQVGLRWRGRVRACLSVARRRTRHPVPFTDEERVAFERIAVVLELLESRVSLEKPIANLDCLTPREREIVSILCLGYTNAEIAEALEIRPTSVRNALTRIFEKLEVSTRSELVARALSPEEGKGTSVPCRDAARPI